MGFSDEVQAEALVASGRSCCICHKFCGTKITLHHIKQKAYGGDDSFDNCIPLCLDCHEDMGKADPNHVTGKHYTEKELRLHRGKWYEFVRKNPVVNSEKSEETKQFLEQYNAIRRNVAENLAMYACCYHHPVDLAKMPDHKMPPMHLEGSDVLRRLASRLSGLADSMSIDDLDVRISDEQLRKAAGCLYYISNSFQTPYATERSQEAHNCLMKNIENLKEVLELQKQPKVYIN